jgi:hypothetical protein
VETTRYQGSGSRYSGAGSADASARGRGSGVSYQESQESDYSYRAGQRGGSRQGSGEAQQGSGGSYRASYGSESSRHGSSGGGSVHYEEGSYYDQSNRGRYASSGSGSGSGDSSASSSSSGKCKYVWSDQNNRWECEGSAPEGSAVTDHGSSDSGWVTLPDGTRFQFYGSPFQSKNFFDNFLSLNFGQISNQSQHKFIKQLWTKLLDINDFKTIISNSNLT